ncbi:MAG: SGNH/GDSL hydrolase family protein, partial [Chitinispirillaceae bacterium]|nr:SGNH/GDSL hydrolase family protein [Chitinispirillaceae bacterium]
PTQCAEGLPIPVNYNILVSGNSTNGIDGEWVVVDSVRGNQVAARGHTISNFKEKFWVKMFVIKGGGKIDEVEVFDISNGNDDTWLFLGTSITANAFKQPVPSKTFSDYIRDYLKDSYPNIYPAIIRGGIGCATLQGILNDIKKIIEASGKVRYFAIEIGLNEASGGKTENLKSFTNNLQTLIKVCRENGIEPVIAKLPSTNPEKAGWQVSEEYLKAIDEITKKNNLTPGPDFYSWFLKNPDELKDDGIHPTQRGGASIQRLWADAVYKLYISDKKEESPK